MSIICSYVTTVLCDHREIFKFSVFEAVAQTLDINEGWCLRSEIACCRCGHGHEWA